MYVALLVLQEWLWLALCKLWTCKHLNAALPQTLRPHGTAPDNIRQARAGTARVKR